MACTSSTVPACRTEVPIDVSQGRLSACQRMIPGTPCGVSSPSTDTDSCLSTRELHSSHQWGLSSEGALCRKAVDPTLPLRNPVITRLWDHDGAEGARCTSKETRVEVYDLPPHGGGRALRRTTKQRIDQAPVRQSGEPANDTHRQDDPVPVCEENMDNGQTETPAPDPSAPFVPDRTVGVRTYRVSGDSVELVEERQTLRLTFGQVEKMNRARRSHGVQPLNRNSLLEPMQVHRKANTGGLLSRLLHGALR